MNHCYRIQRSETSKATDFYKWHPKTGQVWSHAKSVELNHFTWQLNPFLQFPLRLSSYPTVIAYINVINTNSTFHNSLRQWVNKAYFKGPFRDPLPCLLPNFLQNVERFLHQYKPSDTCLCAKYFFQVHLFGEVISKFSILHVENMVKNTVYISYILLTNATS